MPGKKKNNRNNNNNGPKAAASPNSSPQADIASQKAEEAAALDSTTVSDSHAGESTAASPTSAAGDSLASPNAETTAVAAAEAPAASVEEPAVVGAPSASPPLPASTGLSASPAKKAPSSFIIVPTPVEATAAQRIAGFYQRRANGERTAAEAEREAAHAERLADLDIRIAAARTNGGDADALSSLIAERDAAVRLWGHQPAHLLLDVAFVNFEKFARAYIEAEYDAFIFVATTDEARDRAAIAAARRRFILAADGLAETESIARIDVRRAEREGFTALLIERDTERRALLAAEREARRQALVRELPPPLPELAESELNYDSDTVPESSAAVTVE